MTGHRQASRPGHPLHAAEAGLAVAAARRKPEGSGP